MKPFLVLIISLLSLNAKAGHRMQHGFILGKNETFASHLVATGHHSRQVDLTGTLDFEFESEREQFYVLKARGEPVYFLLQAQEVDLEDIKAGQVLEGHIIISKYGEYEPHNVVVKIARFRIKEILLNVPNPFFAN